MKADFSLAGKKAVVTGACRGLGRGMAQGLHEAGVDLALIDVSDSIHAIAKEASRPIFPIAMNSGAVSMRRWRRWAAWIFC
jgi:NAD(P)-dependent dehydrogenase (short-subunit alcohol dehydrogenase family)